MITAATINRAVELLLKEKEYSFLFDIIKKWSAQAEDYTQDLILKILVGGDKYLELFNRGRIKYYLFSVIKHDHFSRNIKPPLFETTYMDSTTEEVSDLSEDLEDLFSAIEEELSKEHWYNRELLNMKFTEGKSYRDIEKETGIDHCSVHKAVKETIERIRGKVINK